MAEDNKQIIEGGSSFALTVWDEYKQRPATLDLKEGDKLCIEFEVRNAKNGLVVPTQPHAMVVHFSGMAAFKTTPEEVVVEDKSGGKLPKEVKPVSEKESKPKLTVVDGDKPTKKG